MFSNEFNKMMFLIGNYDDCQKNIYEFRGSDISYILDFYKVKNCQI
jgi:hypothetical protein